jgi:hypothetical protein
MCVCVYVCVCVCASERTTFTPSPPFASRVKRHHVQHERHCVVEDGLSKHDGVQVVIDVQVVVDGEHGDGVGGRDDGAKQKTLDEVQLHVLDVLVKK